jgi:hypothetical protein
MKLDGISNSPELSKFNNPELTMKLKHNKFSNRA